MNGAVRLPKHATDNGEGVPASANWMKRKWWKYSYSAQKASPPPRFLLVVLLSAQILFLAIVRLGPSASVWGLGPGSPSEDSSLSFAFLRGNAANIPHVSLENEKPADEESKGASSILSVMHVSDAASEERSDDPSSLSLPSENIAHPQDKPTHKQKASSKKRMPKKKKRGKVAPLGQHNSGNTFNTALQKADNKAEMGERYDDLLPSVDDKPPAVDLARNTQKDESPLDISTATVNKQEAHDTEGETTTFSSMMKAQTSEREKSALSENIDKGNEVAEIQAAMEQVLSVEDVKGGASIIEEHGPGESLDKGEEQASSAEKGGEVISNVVTADELQKQESQVVSSKEASDDVEKNTQVELSVKGSASEKGRELDSVKEELPLTEQISDVTSSSACRYGYVYVYDLPPIFNHDIISNCTALNPWLDVCPTLANGGLGDSLGEVSPLGQIGSWFTTDQFTAEMLFHNRILQHKCLTDKMDKASGFYVPFYAGLDVGRYLWEGSSAERRDMVSNQFLDWLIEQPAWKRSGGSDHFMMIGRITWDFRRSRDEDWGSSFFHKPAMKKITKLLIERNPWDVKEMAVPYPTNFHPQSDTDLVAWQNHIRGLPRSNLFSFAGAPRERFPDDFRSILFEQCQQAEHCRSLNCSNRTCDDNQKTLELFMDSTFCLQPRGDSFTRRSTFDCLLAGSIPVFFWHRSAYMQYKWHLPEDETSYSVFISKQDMRNGTRLEEVLKAFSPEKVQSMQEAVIQLVPKIVYAVSGFSLQGNDAFDAAIEGVMKAFKEQSVSSDQ